MSDLPGGLATGTTHHDPQQQSTLSGGFRLVVITFRSSLGDGVLAATGGIVLMLAARLLLGIITPTELVGDRITTLIPLPLFSALLRFFGQNAKHIFFGALLIGQGLATALALAAYLALRAVWLSRRSRGTAVADSSDQLRTRQSMDAQTDAQHADESVTEPVVETQQPLTAVDLLACSVWFWLTSLAVLTPVSPGLIALFGSEVLPGVASSALLLWLRSRTQRKPVVPAANSDRLSRRRALRQVGFAVALLAGTAVVWELVQRGAASLGLLGEGPSAPPLDLGTTPAIISPPPVPVYTTWSSVARQTSELTPIPTFYYVSKNLVGDPSLDGGHWSVRISGMVDHPTTLSLSDIRTLPQVRRYQTLECISNEVGGNLMSTTLWTGAHLADIAAAVGVQVGASQMIFRCADGYSDRHHLTQVLDPRALIVYEMDGQPLPRPHGFPARLLIPGRYGMKNGKWVTELEFASGTYQGYWEQQGWSPEAIVKLTSRIDVPGNGELLPLRPITLAGVAFAGDQGIGRVDVSTDGGRNWTVASLKQPLGALTWVLWELPWIPGRGTHVIVVRAIDLAGRVQSPQVSMPLPDGASGYHAISVTVG